MEIEDLAKEYLKKEHVFAVIGVSRDPEKYGHQVFKDLTNAGYKVYPVNPNADEVLGTRCYPALGELPEVPDVVDIVVPPKITENVVKQCKGLGIKKIWMQPGSESQDAIAYCEKNGMDVLHHVCVMVQRTKLE